MRLLHIYTCTGIPFKVRSSHEEFSLPTQAGESTTCTYASFNGELHEWLYHAVMKTSLVKKLSKSSLPVSASAFTTKAYTQIHTFTFRVGIFSPTLSQSLVVKPFAQVYISVQGTAITELFTLKLHVTPSAEVTNDGPARHARL